jgi:hypothetical protein
MKEKELFRITQSIELFTYGRYSREYHGVMKFEIKVELPACFIGDKIIVNGIEGIIQNKGYDTNEDIRFIILKNKERHFIREYCKTKKEYLSNGFEIIKDVNTKDILEDINGPDTSRLNRWWNCYGFTKYVKRELEGCD